MEALPEDISRRLLNALSVYLRATPANELPGTLRAVRAFRPQALSKRGMEILEALDDAALRARIVHWLEEGKARVARDDAEVLRLYCARPAGWKGKLHALARPSVPRPRQQPQSAALEAARTRAERAKDEARRAREAARTQIEAQKTRAENAERRLKETVARVAELTAELKRVAAEHSKLLADQRRALRLSERAAERAARERDRAQAAARADRKRADTLEKRLTQLEEAAVKIRRPKPQSQPPAAPGPKRSTPRRPLKAPKGLLEDAPETLQAWLATPEAVLLIDGYNVAKAPEAFGELPLADQRRRVVQAVQRLCRRHGVTATIVFDGSEVPPGSARRARVPVAVEYSRPDEIADDHLIGVLEKMPPVPVIFVTNDRELQRRARALGATIATSDQLLVVLR